VDLAALFQTVRRHLVLTVVGITMTFAITAATIKRVQPTYETAGSFQIIGPSQVPGEKEAQNPILSSGSANADLGSAIASIATSEPFIAQVKSEGLSPDFTVTEDDSGPLLQVSALASTPARSEATFVQLQKQIDQESGRLQSGSPPKLLIKFRLQSGDPTTKLQTSSRQRVSLGIFALCIIATIAVIFLVDRFQHRRRERRRSSIDSSPL
jgi:hypothetical protein